MNGHKYADMTVGGYYQSLYGVLSVDYKVCYERSVMGDE